MGSGSVLSREAVNLDGRRTLAWGPWWSAWAGRMVTAGAANARRRGEEGSSLSRVTALPRPARVRCLQPDLAHKYAVIGRKSRCEDALRRHYTYN